MLIHENLFWLGNEVPAIRSSRGEKLSGNVWTDALHACVSRHCLFVPFDRRHSVPAQAADISASCVLA